MNRLCKLHHLYMQHHRLLTSHNGVDLCWDRYNDHHRVQRFVGNRRKHHSHRFCPAHMPSHTCRSALGLSLYRHKRFHILSGFVDTCILLTHKTSPQRRRCYMPHSVGMRSAYRHMYSHIVFVQWGICIYQLDMKGHWCRFFRTRHSDHCFFGDRHTHHHRQASHLRRYISPPDIVVSMNTLSHRRHNGQGCYGCPNISHHRAGILFVYMRLRTIHRSAHHNCHRRHYNLSSLLLLGGYRRRNRPTTHLYHRSAHLLYKRLHHTIWMGLHNKVFWSPRHNDNPQSYRFFRHSRYLFHRKAQQKVVPHRGKAPNENLVHSIGSHWHIHPFPRVWGRLCSTDVGWRGWYRRRMFRQAHHRSVHRSRCPPYRRSPQQGALVPHSLTNDLSRGNVLALNDTLLYLLYLLVLHSKTLVVLGCTVCHYRIPVDNTGAPCLSHNHYPLCKREEVVRTPRAHSTLQYNTCLQHIEYTSFSSSEPVVIWVTLFYEAEVSAESPCQLDMDLVYG